MGESKCWTASRHRKLAICDFGGYKQSNAQLGVPLGPVRSNWQRRLSCGGISKAGGGCANYLSSVVERLSNVLGGA